METESSCQPSTKHRSRSRRRWNRRRAPRIHVPGDPAQKGPAPELAEALVSSDVDDATASNGDGRATSAETDASDVTAAEGAATDSDAPPVVKRKTRRGSRGGKNHRKKPAATGDAIAIGEGEPNGAVSLDGETPTPDRDDAPVAVAAVEGASVESPVPDVSPAEPVVEVPAAPAAAPEQGDAGYVPMSEWLDDFDRR